MSSDAPDKSGDEKLMPTGSHRSSWQRRAAPSEAGFDSWLTRSLRASYGDALHEAVPTELLDLVRRNSQP